MGHKSPDIHLEMLRVASEHDFRFDTVQMPLKVMDAHFESFEKKVLPILIKDEIGILGMKPMGDGTILKSGTATPIECLHYSMNLPTSVVITGCDSMEILEQAFTAARTFQPMKKKDMDDLLARTSQVAAEGRLNYTRQQRNMTAPPAILNGLENKGPTDTKGRHGELPAWSYI